MKLIFIIIVVGCISILHVEMNSEDMNSEKRIVRSSPIFNENFAILSLGDRIKNQDTWRNLFPNVPKDEAFGKYYSHGNCSGFIIYTEQNYRLCESLYNVYNTSQFIHGINVTQNIGVYTKYMCMIKPVSSLHDNIQMEPH